jgi:hypothetical protein
MFDKGRLLFELPTEALPSGIPKHLTRVHIDLKEAIDLLQSWKDSGATLQLSYNVGGESRKIPTRVLQVNGSNVVLADADNRLELDISRAEFNGDRRSPVNSNQGPYLVCEFRNDDRWAFHAPRVETVIVQERRNS